MCQRVPPTHLIKISKINYVLGLKKTLKIYLSFLIKVIIFLGMLPLAWDVSVNTCSYLGYGTDYEVQYVVFISLLLFAVQVLQTLVFILICILYDFVSEKPWSIYSTFVIEERHGFNKQVSYYYPSLSLPSSLP